MFTWGVARSPWTKAVPPESRAMKAAVWGVICIRPRAPAWEVWSRKRDSSKMTAAISAGSSPLSDACWRMMSSCSRGRVTLRTVSPSGPTPAMLAAAKAPMAAAISTAMIRRRRCVRPRRADVRRRAGADLLRVDVRAADGIGRCPVDPGNSAGHPLFRTLAPIRGRVT